jgi:membrane fusion protein PltH
MQRRVIAVGLLVALAAVIAFAWRRTHRSAPDTDLILHGNIDLREVDLPFNEAERIANILVQEGDRVRAGQVIARLDTARLAPQAAQAAALTAAQRDAVDRFHHGNRPEEVAEAQANVESARADAETARDHYERLRSLAANHIVSEQDVDNAKDAMDVAQAKLAVSEKAYELERLGPRSEDIAQAENQLRADEAQLALLRQHVADAVLLAPSNGVVQARLMEPGEMASPDKPVISLAITDPKWVRTYVSEPDLGKVHPGAQAFITVDAFPRQRFPGWVGFVSSIAEFTPKEVQTEALRPSLVYEVRVFVRDTADVLRLGMPATVSVSTAATLPERDTGRSLTVPAIPEPAPSSRP